MPVYIGLLMLMGIVTKNAIMLVDFAVEEVGRGVPRFEARYRRRPQARPPDRHDDAGDGCRHAAQRPWRSATAASSAPLWLSR